MKKETAIGVAISIVILVGGVFLLVPQQESKCNRYVDDNTKSLVNILMGDDDIKPLHAQIFQINSESFINECSQYPNYKSLSETFRKTINTYRETGLLKENR